MLLGGAGHVAAKDAAPNAPHASRAAPVSPAKTKLAKTPPPPAAKPAPKPLLLLDPAKLLGVEPPLSAQAAILIDAETGQVLWEHHSTRRMYPASLTKMMSGLLAAESGRLDEVFRASQAAASTGESTIHLQLSEPLKLLQVLQAALIQSANDATVMLAESVAGSVAAFVAMMNDRAAAMGLGGTHFVNPTGLHDANHYATAADLAELARRAMKNDVFARIVRTPETFIPCAARSVTAKAGAAKALPQDEAPDEDGAVTDKAAGKPPAAASLLLRKLTNRNRLLRRWDKCDGIKTGFTHPAGRCLAASATVDDWRLICVVLKCRDSWTDAQNLLQWGFVNYRRQCVAQSRDVYQVAVHRGARRTVQARPQDNLYVIARSGELGGAATQDPKPCEAPVEPGDIVGHLRTAAGASVPLLATEAVPLSLWARICSLRIWQVGAGLALLLAAGVLLYGASAKTARTRRRRLAARQREADRAGASDGGRSAGTTGD